MIRIIQKLLFLISIGGGVICQAQEKITFPSKDGLLITADYYKGIKSKPCILFCHQAKSSRGEYSAAAKQLQKLGYNIIAIDQRSGDVMNGVVNETAIAAKNKKLPTNFINAKQDIQAAIEYSYNRFQKKIILVGSSYSASLVLLLSVNNDMVAKVVAFSPGEYFNESNFVASQLENLKTPTLVLSTKSEASQVTDLIKNCNHKIVKQFVPLQDGEHGAKVLSTGDATTNEFWKAFMDFLKLPS
jgi:dienelactone hydrolase